MNVRTTYAYVAFFALLVLSAAMVESTVFKRLNINETLSNFGKRQSGAHGLLQADNSRILGGEFANKGQFPYQVFILLRKNGNDYECGGSLISTEWVLTAAHCTKGSDNFRLYLGATDMGDPNEANRVMMVPTQIIPHEKFVSKADGSADNDIAVLKLPQAAPINQFIKVVRLPKVSEACVDFAKRSAIVTGFGRTSNDAAVAAAAPIKLKFVDLIVMTNKDCSVSKPGLADEKLCTMGDLVKDSCVGDSGGPLVVKEEDTEYTQVGIVSYGPNPCADGTHGVYARVSSYLDWITQKTGIVPRP